jgi:5-hydroxyisourate hydrolase-like protein (transthyretin family)
MSKLLYYAITVITLGLVSVFSPAESGDHIEINVPIQGMRGRVGKCTVELLDTEDNVIGRAYRYSYINKDYFSLPVKIKLQADVEDFDLVHVKVQFKDDVRMYSLHQLRDRMVVKILGQDQFIKGTTINYRVIVQNQRSNEPLENANVRVTLKTDDTEKSVFEGRTDRSGTCRTDFILADDIEHAELRFLVSSEIGEDEYTASIKIVSGNVTYLVTDKPIYQPGQVIHIRTLSLKKPDLASVSGDVTFEVEDSKGNKVFKKVMTTDEFGTAYVPFRLADEVNFGDYTIRAVLTGEKTEKTVKVEKYVLPKFKITMKTDREFYLPGERVEGDVDVQYFFGKPVVGGKVKITVFRYDIGFQKEAEIDGKTGDDGMYHFTYDLPDYFVGEPLEKGNAFVRLDVEVIDQANHSEKISAKKKVVRDVIGLSIVPEGGMLRPGLDNRIYVLANYPDGTPCMAQVEMQIDKKKMTAKTDEFGIAEFSYRPEDTKTIIQVTARDDKGESASLEKSFSLDVDRDQIIMARRSNLTS